MNRAIRQAVWDRANGRCEYCQINQRHDLMPFQIDHVRAIKHGGTSDLDNLALSCLPCNAHKGPNISGVDPETQAVAVLFDPRQNPWPDHFRWNGPALVGLYTARQGHNRRPQDQ